jgi:hypothetical protein
VGISESRKSKAGTPPILSKNNRTQRRPVKAAMPQGHPFRVNGTEFARRRFLHLTAGAAALPAISRGATAQTYPSRRIWADEPIEVARLEFVGVTGNRRCVAHAVIACPTLKEVAEGKCCEGGVAACAAAADDDAV